MVTDARTLGLRSPQTAGAGVEGMLMGAGSLTASDGRRSHVQDKRLAFAIAIIAVIATLLVFGILGP